jgi:hypothetical protein
VNQKHQIKQKLNGSADSNILIPEKPIPAKELILASDLIVGSGGTMVREAAVFGVPAYTFFQGKDGAVDKYLAKEGRLVFVRDLTDVDRIEVRKRDQTSLLKAPVNQVKWICSRIEEQY